MTVSPEQLELSQAAATPSRETTWERKDEETEAFEVFWSGWGGHSLYFFAACPQEKVWCNKVSFFFELSICYKIDKWLGRSIVGGSTWLSLTREKMKKTFQWEGCQSKCSEWIDFYAFSRLSHAYCVSFLKLWHYPCAYFVKWAQNTYLARLREAIKEYNCHIHYFHVRQWRQEGRHI